MQLLRALDTFLNILDHGDMLGNDDVAQLFPNHLKCNSFNISPGLVQTIEQPPGKMLLVMHEKAILGRKAGQEEKDISALVSAIVIVHLQSYA